MGRQKLSKPRRERPLPVRTTEPETALPGWPRSHARVELTDDQEGECVKVTIHGVEHLIHATTARALSDDLLEKLNTYNAGVREAFSDPDFAAAVGSVLGGKPVSVDDMIV
jgi:hypothetical protein